MIKRAKNDGKKRIWMIVALSVLTLALMGGIIFGLVRMGQVVNGVWQEQCRITDRDLDVVITSSGKMVHPDVVTLHFGLTNGANLATIPFNELRKRLLERVPNVRDLHIERRMPNRVTIEVQEREPVARISTRREPAITGRVADADGVIFWYNVGDTIAQLPLVRESSDQPTAPGKRLTGLSAAALRLIEAASMPELAELKVREIDTSRKDYLYATFANLDHAHIAWDQMKDDTAISRSSLQKQLKNLFHAISTRLTPTGTTWLATDWGPHSRITASGSVNRAGN